jgi:hypothetical protein
MLQHAHPTSLAAALPQKLLHISSAFVRRCVQMFMWVAQLAGFAKAAARSGAYDPVLQDCDNQLAPPTGPLSHQQHQEAQATATIQHRLLNSMQSAGISGPVDL